MGSLLGWVRWLGVAYLVYLAIRQWRAPPADLSAVQPQKRDARAMVRRAMLVSLANPKTLFFYGAFLPQFIEPGDSLPGQIALLSVTFVAIAVVVDGGWALLAARARRLLARHAVARNRVSGGFLFGAAVGLAAVRSS
jgi:threonine/homoserine/homoserine lactone efflux protein